MWGKVNSQLSSPLPITLAYDSFEPPFLIKYKSKVSGLYLKSILMILTVDGLAKITLTVTYSTPGWETQGSSELSIILDGVFTGLFAVLVASAWAPLALDATLS